MFLPSSDRLMRSTVLGDEAGMKLRRSAASTRTLRQRALRLWRITGREGSRRATVLNPSRLNTEAVPVNTLEVLPGRLVSTGYASTAGALARLAAFSASRIRA